MKKQHRSLILFLSAIFLVFALILILLLLPDMSSTVIDTVPEYPPTPVTGINPDSEASQAVMVDKANVKNIISAISRPTEYFSETKSVLIHSGGSAEYSRKKWVKGELSRVDIISSNSQQTVSAHYVYSKDNVFVWKPGASTYYKTARGEFEPDDAQMMMSYEDIISASDDSITAAQNTLYDGSLCIYAEVKNTETGYTERYWVSASNGLLLHGQTLNTDGNVIYSITSTHIDISTQDISIFNLPDGTVPN